MNDEQQERLNTRLQKAIQTNNKKAAEELLNKGADKNIIIDKESNFLINSVISGSSEMAAFLIENGANVNQKDQMNRTPLHYVRDKNMAKILLNAGADVTAQDSNKKTPTMRADERGKVEVAKVIEEKGNEQQQNKVDTNDLKPKGIRSLMAFAKPLNFNLKKVAPATKEPEKNRVQQSKKKNNGRKM